MPEFQSASERSSSSCESDGAAGFGAGAEASAAAVGAAGFVSVSAWLCEAQRRVVSVSIQYGREVLFDGVRDMGQVLHGVYVPRQFGESQEK